MVPERISEDQNHRNDKAVNRSGFDDRKANK